MVIKMKKAIVYGCGSFCSRYKNSIVEKFDVIGYVDANRNVSKGSQLIYHSLEEVDIKYDFVIVMVENIKILFELIQIILSMGISNENILLGIQMWGKYSAFDRIGVTKDGNIQIVKEDVELIVAMPDEFYSASEIFINNCYNYYLPGNNPEIVIDVGMNIGDSTLYFAKRENVMKVYGYEPFVEAFSRAERNLKSVGDKVEIFNEGLSDLNETRRCVCYDDMSTGLSTNSEYTEKSKNDRIYMGLIENSVKKEEDVVIRKAAEVIRKIIETNGLNKQYVLKLDCEGDEYAIFKDLFDEGLLDSFSYMIIEWHNKGCNELTHYLKKINYSFHSLIIDLTRDRGMIYAFRN